MAQPVIRGKVLIAPLLPARGFRRRGLGWVYEAALTSSATRRWMESRAASYAPSNIDITRVTALPHDASAVIEYEACADTYADDVAVTAAFNEVHDEVVKQKSGRVLLMRCARTPWVVPEAYLVLGVAPNVIETHSRQASRRLDLDIVAVSPDSDGDTTVPASSLLRSPAVTLEEYLCVRAVTVHSVHCVLSSLAPLSFCVCGCGCVSVCLVSSRLPLRSLLSRRKWRRT